MFISVEFLEDFVIPAKVAAELEIIGKPVDRVTEIPYWRDDSTTYKKIYPSQFFADEVVETENADGDKIFVDSEGNPVEKYRIQDKRADGNFVEIQVGSYMLNFEAIHKVPKGIPFHITNNKIYREVK